jgi:hypothetical protein
MISCERYFLLFKRRQDNTFFCLPSILSDYSYVANLLEFRTKNHANPEFFIFAMKKSRHKKIPDFYMSK